MTGSCLVANPYVNVCVDWEHRISTSGFFIQSRVHFFKKNEWMCDKLVIISALNSDFSYSNFHIWFGESLIYCHYSFACRWETLYAEGLSSCSTAGVLMYKVNSSTIIYPAAQHTKSETSFHASNRSNWAYPSLLIWVHGKLCYINRQTTIAIRFLLANHEFGKDLSPLCS
jgi:hypothetical protein